MSEGNGLMAKVERLGRLVERLGLGNVLALILVGLGVYGYVTFARVHDAKLDALLAWTRQKTAFDHLDCVREATTVLMVDLCEKANRGEPLTPVEIRGAWSQDHR